MQSQKASSTTTDAASHYQRHAGSSECAGSGIPVEVQCNFKKRCPPRQMLPLIIRDMPAALSVQDLAFQLRWNSTSKSVVHLMDWLIDSLIVAVSICFMSSQQMGPTIAWSLCASPAASRGRLFIYVDDSEFEVGLRGSKHQKTNAPTFISTSTKYHKVMPFRDDQPPILSPSHSTSSSKELSFFCEELPTTIGDDVIFEVNRSKFQWVSKGPKNISPSWHCIWNEWDKGTLQRFVNIFGLQCTTFSPNHDWDGS